MRPFLLALLLVVVCLPLFEKLKKQICNGKEKSRMQAKVEGFVVAFLASLVNCPDASRYKYNQKSTYVRIIRSHPGLSRIYAPTLELDPCYHHSQLHHLYIPLTAQSSCLSPSSSRPSPR